jgi:hypothetical protein
MTSSYVLAAVALKTAPESLSTYAVSQGNQSRGAQEIIAQIEALKDKCNMFAAANGSFLGIQSEGRLLIDLFTAVTSLVTSTLRSEINLSISDIFTEKDPSSIQPFINQSTFEFIINIQRELQNIILKWGESRLLTLHSLGIEIVLTSPVSIDGILSLVLGTFK